MKFKSYQGHYMGKTKRFSMRPLAIACEKAGIEHASDKIGCFQIAELDELHRITESGVLACESRRFLMAFMPHRLKSGKVMGVYGNLPLYLAGEPKCPGTWASWLWDGNREAPTLSPSIGSVGMHDDPPTGWHGFLQNGVWRACE